jgi:hypothetical protein
MLRATGLKEYSQEETLFGGMGRRGTVAWQFTYQKLQNIFGEFLKFVFSINQDPMCGET